MNNALIFVTFKVEGWHYWPMATGRRAYLGQKHRHLFHVKVWCETLHDDREIEFHDLLDQSKFFFGSGDFGEWSCEHMARLLAEKLGTFYNRDFTVEVSEDGECGSLVRYEGKVAGHGID